MSHIKHTLTTALAGLALASLPVLVDAQSTPTPQTPTTRASQPNRSASPDKNSPQHHLDEARRVLTSITPNSVQGETRSKINELKRHFMQLETAFRTSSAGSARMGASRSTEPPPSSGTATGSTTSGTGTAGTTGTSGTATSGTTEQAGRSAPGQRSGTGDWMTHYTAIDSLLDELIGSGASADASMSGTTGSTSGSATGSTSGSTSGTTAGTSGSPTEQRGTTARSGESASGSTQIDANVRTKLVEFKRHLDQFHSAATNQSGRGEEDMASADPSSGVTGSMTRPDPSSSTASSTGATGTSGSATSGTTGSATGTTGSTSATGHPTTTSPETPEATGTSGTSSTMAGTAGTSRTATTQSTQTSAQASVDSAAIARLTASIDEMLRGSASTSTTAGTASTTGSTTASGTVGTSGTSSSTGTVCVDRAKLEELKTQIQALQNRPR